MNFSSILNDLTGSANSGLNAVSNGSVGNLGSRLPGGLAGGAVAGGVMALLVGNKSVRKKAGKAASYGGAALLGGLAYKAYKDWQQNSHSQNQLALNSNTTERYAQYEQETLAHQNGVSTPQSYQITLIKAMIASARADGQIDAHEQRRISEAIEKMNLDATTKSEILNLFLQPISVSDIVGNLETEAQKAEVYLASCLAIELDDEAEYVHLSALSHALSLPPGLEHQLRSQAMNAISAAA